MSQHKQLFPFAALSASYFAHIGFFNPYLPLWLKELGFSLIAIAVLTSVQSATRLFAPYAWGMLSDRTGERVKLLRFGATVALLLSMGLWFPLGGVALFVVLLLMFTHTSAMMPMSEAALAHLVSQGGAFDAKRYGRVRLWGSLGFLVTVVSAGWWFERFGMGHFPAWTLVTLAAVVVSVWLLPDFKEAVQHEDDHPNMWPVLRLPEVRWFFAAVFFHVLAHIFVYVFFSLYLDSLGYSKTVIGLLWALSVVIEIGWFFFQGRWLPLLSLTGWLVLAAALMALRMGLTAGLPLVLPLLLLAQALHAITFAAHHTVCIALLSHHFPGRLRGRGQALYTVVGYGLPGVLGGLGGGLLSSAFGLASVFWLAAGCALVGMCCALRLRQRGQLPR
ncbi:MAG: MFS transporter [Hydrogenophaga sp.]|uniref:MFS transporter n=1 Tax=Hydrogenophaga sp. TaxID=1904254 RepID=UPI0027252B45|nr:MFS transporter [Hydrogenophaga sp.]MDO9481141.1 MFS transporter [Hydrogenophaga sp.]MDP3346229.1 MFS transporter [Hydrogenophaga sp.]MDP3808840.1 MFS transporter [Hydrogenophaga sp.]